MKKNAEYQVAARRYRPKTFGEVLGQETIVTILLNSIRNNRLAHAYLFCGPRGTGKTTLARILAKALNCANLKDNLEPCNECQACKEISSGNSLDVLEIDGASHRGIDDVRQINETVGYAASSGKYKIYLIDEVHMLTQEAFNALLKTLEEPPPKVKFFFATTEPHKLPATILSRCQRLNLKRIPIQSIIAKLKGIVESQGRKADDDALYVIARRSEGCLRDAESLFEQALAFHEGDLTAEAVSSVLGIMSNDSLFKLDRAASEGNVSAAFEIVHELFFQGKDFIHFVEMLIDHFRNILMIKVAGKEATFLSIPDTEREKYLASAKIYRQEQCLNILEYLVEKQGEIRFMPSPRIALEAILLHIIRSQHQIPVEFLVRRLSEIESSIQSNGQESAPTAMSKSIPKTDEASDLASAPVPKLTPKTVLNLTAPPAPKMTPKNGEVSDLVSAKMTPKTVEMDDTTSKPVERASEVRTPPIQPAVESKTFETAVQDKKQHQYDTMLQFAAVELEGTIQKKSTLR